MSSGSLAFTTGEGHGRSSFLVEREWDVTLVVGLPFAEWWGGVAGREGLLPVVTQRFFAPLWLNSCLSLTRLAYAFPKT